MESSVSGISWDFEYSLSQSIMVDFHDCISEWAGKEQHFASLLFLRCSLYQSVEGDSRNGVSEEKEKKQSFGNFVRLWVFLHSIRCGGFPQSFPRMDGDHVASHGLPASLTSF